MNRLVYTEEGRTPPLDQHCKSCFYVFLKKLNFIGSSVLHSSAHGGGTRWWRGLAGSQHAGIGGGGGVHGVRSLACEGRAWRARGEEGTEEWTLLGRGDVLCCHDSGSTAPLFTGRARDGRGRRWHTLRLPPQLCLHQLQARMELHQHLILR